MKCFYILHFNFQGRGKVSEEGGGQVSPGPGQLRLREEAGEGHQPGDLRSQDHPGSRAAQEGREEATGGPYPRPQKSLLRIPDSSKFSSAYNFVK